jgi:hypothetical protein
MVGWILWHGWLLWYDWLLWLKYECMLPTWFSMVNWCYVWPRIDLDFSLWLGILTLSNREISSRRRKRIYIYILLVEKILVCFYWLDLVAHRILVIVTCHDCCDMYIIKINQVILSHIYIYIYIIGGEKLFVAHLTHYFLVLHHALPFILHTIIPRYLLI